MLLRPILVFVLIGYSLTDDPNDVIQSQFLHKYVVNDTKDVYHRRYVLHETDPKSVLLCPKGSFIAKVRILFKVVYLVCLVQKQ